MKVTHSYSDGDRLNGMKTYEVEVTTDDLRALVGKDTFSGLTIAEIYTHMRYLAELLLMRQEAVPGDSERHMFLVSVFKELGCESELR